MLPEEELEGDLKTHVRANLPGLLTRFLKRISADVSNSKAIVIFVTHFIANTGASGAFAKKRISDCENQLQFQTLPLF